MTQVWGQLSQVRAENGGGFRWAEEGCHHLLPGRREAWRRWEPPSSYHRPPSLPPTEDRRNSRFPPAPPETQPDKTFHLALFTCLSKHGQKKLCIERKRKLWQQNLTDFHQLSFFSTVCFIPCLHPKTATNASWVLLGNYSLHPESFYGLYLKKT